MVMDVPSATQLQRFCLAHDDATLIAAELLGPEGLDPALADCLRQSGRLTAAQVDCLAQGFALYWRRCAELFTRAPAAWFAPRRTNLLIAARHDAVLPYLEPFAGTSSLLYASDLDTDPEYVAYLLLHMERLALLNSVRPTLVHNLSYWLLRQPDERAAFARGAGRATRPDAAAFVKLADAMPWLADCLHDPLRLPAASPQEPYVEITGVDLFVPKRSQAALLQLCEDFEAATHGALHAAAAGPLRTGPAQATLDALCDWLEAQRAHVLVKDARGRTLWAPDSRDASALRIALAGASSEAVASLHADLRVVDARSRRFLHALREPAALPRQCGVLETGGGAYVDAERQVVVYELQQPGFDALRVAAPPYHRLLLGARVMHEWGHLAYAGKLLHVPPARQTAWQEARQALGEQFMQVLQRVPARLQDEVERELRELSRAPSERPRLLARKTMARVGDYLANLLSARLIPAEEMQAYVRANVRHHMNEQLGLVSELARYAYEVHYLALAGIERDYFYATSRFGAYFIDSGIVSRADAEALFDAAGQVLACWAIDESQLDLTTAIA